MEDHECNMFETRPYPQAGNAEFALGGPEQKTMPYSGVVHPHDLAGNNLPTQVYQPEMPVVKRTVTHNIGMGDSVELNSIRYEILEILSGDGKTSEAVIYKVKDPNDKIFVLKLYYEFQDTHHEPNSDTLQRIREIRSDELLSLFDFGAGPNKHLNRYCFEISSFAEGGDLLKVEDVSEKYTAEFIEDRVVPFIHKGLQVLHAERIYHCDLKPQNVFYLDKKQTRIVIGDYGSAKSFDKSSEKELSYTTLTRGTEFYLAPEQAFGIVSDKNDYYSLGMIVLHLMYPAEVNRKNLRKIFERRTKGLPIIDFDEKFARLNRLIEGLTLQDYNSRWGSNELERWLAGEDVPVNYGGASRLSRITLDGVVIKTGNDLVKALKSDRKIYNSLIDDVDGYASLLAWVRMTQGEEEMKLFGTMIAHYKKHFGAEYVKDALLFYFDPDHHITVGAESFRFGNALDTGEQVGNFFRVVDSQWKVSEFGLIRLWFFRLEIALLRFRERAGNKKKLEVDALLEQMAAIIGVNYAKDLSAVNASLFIHLENKHLPDLFHRYLPKRGFKDLTGNTYSTLFEVETFLKSNPVCRKMDLVQFEKSSFIKSRSKDEMVEFIEFCDDLSGFFFEKDDDFLTLVSMVSRFSNEEYSIQFVEGVLRFYRNADNFIQQEVLLRLINPTLPVFIGGENIYLYNTGDFENKIREFFTVLESERFTKTLEELRLIFFSFEFCLMQVAHHDPNRGKALIEPVFKRLHEVIKGNYPEWKVLRASFYQGVDNEKLVAVLHRFNPSRVFCTHTGDYLATIQDVALYYLQNPEQFQLELSGHEREFYLKKSGNTRLSGLSFRDFILGVFRSETTFTARINEVSFDVNETNEVIVYYDYELSLEKYLKSRGLDTGMVFKSETINKVVLKKKQLDTMAELFGKFAGKIKKRHAFGVMSPSTQQSFEDAVKRARKQELRELLLLLPRYTIYLLPAFGLLFLSAGYLLEYSLFKQISYDYAPALRFVAARFVDTSASSLLFAAYFLNLAVAVLMVIPLLSLQRHKGRFRLFDRDYGSLIGRMAVVLVFAPVIFVGIFTVLEPIFGSQLFESSAVMPAVSTLQFTILLYIAFVFFQAFLVIRAFFKVSKKIRLVPLTVSILMYLAAGYFAILKYTLI